MSKILRMGVDRFYAPPLSWIEEGQIHGFVGSLVSSLSAAFDVKIDIFPMEQSELGEALDAGAIDLRFPDNAAWEYRSLKGSFSDTVITYADAFFIKKDVGLPERPCLGTLTEYPLPDDPAVNQVKGNSRYYNTVEELMTALWAQDVHILFGPVHAFRHVLNHSPHLPEMEQVDWLPVIMDDYHFAIKPGDEILQRQVNDWIARHKGMLGTWDGQPDVIFPG